MTCIVNKQQGQSVANLAMLPHLKAYFKHLVKRLVIDMVQKPK